MRIYLIALYYNKKEVLCTGYHGTTTYLEIEGILINNFQKQPFLNYG